MKSQKVRDLDENELQHQLREMEEQLFRLHFRCRWAQMEGLKKVRAMRKDRARILHHPARAGTGAGAKK